MAGIGSVAALAPVASMPFKTVLRLMVFVGLIVMRVHSFDSGLLAAFRGPAFVEPAFLAEQWGAAGKAGGASQSAAW
jgi:hypothetical protein